MSKVKSSRKEQFLMVRKIGDRKSEQKDDSMFRPGGGAAGANRLNLSTSGAEESRDAESKTTPGVTETSKDEADAVPLSKEQLRNLLSDFLHQLTVSKPPAK
jgi:hypothetical protein